MIVLVRHGRTDANRRGLLLGRADPGLDETGRTQARALGAALAEDLADRSPIRVVTSPLQRTSETAAAIASALGVEATPEPALLEIDYGEWDERPLGDVPADAWRAWRADADFAAPGGESLRALQARVGPCIERLLAEARASGERGVVVAVTHVSPIKAGVVAALGGDPLLAWHLRVDVASRTRLISGPDGPVLASFNERLR